MSDNIIDFVPKACIHNKEWLISKVRGAAEWRAQKAVEYPDDRRNEQCSGSLTELADYLDRLPPGHPVYRKITALDLLEDQVINDWIDGISGTISVFGFHRSVTLLGMISELEAVTDFYLTGT